MTPFWHDDHLTLYGGDCRAVLAELPAESVHCVVTSPPYWGLRDYGTGGQLGLEPTPEAYVANMVAVFREVRRVLRDDGTLWLNLGDSYNNRSVTRRSSHQKGLGFTSEELETSWRDMAAQGRATLSINGGPFALKEKDLVGIPWRVAFALQADGWYLRSDIIWAKPNPMPESVTDRPTKAHEYLFLLTKSARYYFDGEAVREAGKDWTTGGPGTGIVPTTHYHPDNGGNEGLSGLAARYKAGEQAAGRNIRTVWTIATEPYPGAHFATFPRKLVEPCVKAGTSERGVCPECGAPWERVVERPEPTLAAKKGPKGEQYGTSDVDRRSSFHVAGWRKAEADLPQTTGWRPTCAHTAEPIPAVVLDPFAGSGTTLLVAQALGRRGVGIDLNPEYLQQALARNAQTPLGLVG